MRHEKESVGEINRGRGDGRDGGVPGFLMNLDFYRRKEKDSSSKSRRTTQNLSREGGGFCRKMGINNDVRLNR